MRWDRQSQEQIVGSSSRCDNLIPLLLLIQISHYTQHCVEIRWDNGMWYHAGVVSSPEYDHERNSITLADPVQLLWRLSAALEWVSLSSFCLIRHTAIYDYLSLISSRPLPFWGNQFSIISLHPEEGDDCTLGLIGAPVPSTVCGPDLTCTRAGEDEHATCQYSEIYYVYSPRFQFESQ